ncbi:uncharacterized protein [Haliotis asinina]|uniref:uncharacterized protein n=1 Tax=Haliotis asinina TaxID=109174 RepID=UPI003531F379
MIVFTSVTLGGGSASSSEAPAAKQGRLVEPFAPSGTPCSKSRFSYDGVCYQFTVLPFGISTAQKVFTKLMLVPATLARSQGRRCHHYRDDWLLSALSQPASLDSTHAVIDILVWLGWIINLKKSDQVPPWSWSFQVHNTSGSSVFVAQPGQQSMSSFLSQPHDPARTWFRLLGPMAVTVSVVWQAQLRMHPIQQALASLWAHSEDLEKCLTVPRWLSPHLQWWTDVVNLYTGVPLELPTPTLTVQTDVSLMGWGTFWAVGRCLDAGPKPEASLHSNVSELRAVRLVFEYFLDHVRGQVVRLQLDNHTAMTYILTQGGTVSQALLEETWDFILWCDRCNCQVIPVYLSGLRNVRADALSHRILAPHEWMLYLRIFGVISQMHGSFQVDLFASGGMNQIPVFGSRIPEVVGV